MHKDAELNYSTEWGFEQIIPDISGWTDREVVLGFWNNTRYATMTGDRNISQASPELNKVWSEFLAADSDDDWKKLRLKFEENGWHGSPVKN